MGTIIESIRKKEIVDTDFYEYWNQCRMLNYAANGNYKLLQEAIKEPSSTENDFKQLGYFNSTLLLRAVAIENLIKARILFMMKKDGSLLKYTTLNEIINEVWTRKISHNPIKLCEKYKIELNNLETNFIQNHLDYMDWAGRFPFPINTDKIKSSFRNRAQ
jgi:hypothetical protein